MLCKAFSSEPKVHYRSHNSPPVDHILIHTSREAQIHVYVESYDVTRPARFINEYNADPISERST